jgi:hypothetical protein
VQHLLTQYQENGIDANAFLNGTLGEELQSFVADLLTEKHELSPRWREKIKAGVPVKNENTEMAVEDAIKELQIFRVMEALENTRKAIFEAEKSGKDETELLRQQIELSKLRKELIQ